MRARSTEDALGFVFAPYEADEPRAPTWEDLTPGVDRAAGETSSQDDFRRYDPVSREPRIDRPRTEVTLWLRGQVTEVDRETGEFSAILTDDRGRRSVAQVDLDSLDPRDRDDIVSGTKFLYVVSREYWPDGMRNSQQFLVDPIRKWTEFDEESASRTHSMRDAADNNRSVGAGKRMIRTEYATARGAVSVEIHALSPSMRDEEYYFSLLGGAIPRVGEPVVPFPDRDHNIVSAGLAVFAGPCKVLLCSDIESGRESGMGWRGILADKDLPSLRADLVKVSHHGSPTSHLDEAWKVHGRPHAAMTPYWRGRTKRPTKEDVERTQAVARTVHDSAKSEGGNPRQLFRAAKKATALKNWRTIDESPGVIRCRMTLEGSEVRVDLFGQARKC